MSTHKQSISVSVKAIVIRDNRVLVIKYNDPVVHYNFPGGRLFDGETLRQGLHRKLWQECRAKIDVERLLFVYEHLPHPTHPERGDYQKVQFNFLARLEPGSEPINPEAAKDQDSVVWIPVGHLRDLPLIPPIAPKVLACLDVGTCLPDPLVPHDRSWEAVLAFDGRTYSLIVDYVSAEELDQA